MSDKINIYARYLMKKDNNINRFANQLSNKSLHESYIEETERVKDLIWERYNNDKQKQYSKQTIKELEELAKQELIKEIRKMFDNK